MPGTAGPRLFAPTTPCTPHHPSRQAQPPGKPASGLQVAAEEPGARPGASFQSTVPADRVGIMSPWDFSPQASTDLGPGPEQPLSPPESSLRSPSSRGPSSPREGSLSASARPGDKFLAEDGALSSNPRARAEAEHRSAEGCDLAMLNSAGLQFRASLLLSLQSAGCWELLPAGCGGR